MSTTPTKTGVEGVIRFQELRRFQVYRLERERPRTLLRRIRRTLRAHLAR